MPSPYIRILNPNVLSFLLEVDCRQSSPNNINRLVEVNVQACLARRDGGSRREIM